MMTRCICDAGDELQESEMEGILAVVGKTFRELKVDFLLK